MAGVRRIKGKDKNDIGFQSDMEIQQEMKVDGNRRDKRK